MQVWAVGVLVTSFACCAVASPRRVGADPVTQASAIREGRPVVFPPYSSYRGMSSYAPTPEDYARAIDDQRFVMERLTYRSDGLDVHAYLYRPATPPKDDKLPVVVFNRGSYVRDEFAPEVLMLGNRLAARGYLVIAPMLRGSGGAQGRDEMGGSEVNDVLNTVPVLSELPYADPQRVFLYGESRGGIMCLLAAKHGFPARAMAVYGTITDLEAYLAEDSAARALGRMIWGDAAVNEAEIAAARSAIRWPEKINVPVLIMNGGSDRQVSPLHALQLAAALEKLRKPYELKIFYGEGHVLPGRAAERDEDAIRWFRRFDDTPGRAGADR